MKILIFIIVAIGQFHCDDPDYEHDYIDFEYSDYSLPDKLGFFERLLSTSYSKSLAPRSRNTRDANANLDTTVDRMQKIARITNGIYLIQGFTEGTITSDNFISELLHLGKVTPTIIKTMGLDGLQKALIEISSTKMPETADGTRIEQQFLVYDEIRNKTSGISVLGADDVEHYIRDLRGLSYELSIFNDLNEALKVFRQEVEFLSNTDHNIPDFNKTQRFAILTRLSQLHDSVPTLQKVFQKNPKLFLGDRRMPDSNRIVMSIRNALEGAKLFNKHGVDLSKHPGDKKGTGLYNENIKRLIHLGALFKTVQSEMGNVRSIYTSRKQRETSSLLYTNGLPEGASDLTKTAKDFDDPWIKSLTSQTDSLRKALEPISSLGAMAGSVDASLQTSADEKLKVLDEVSKIGHGLLPFAENSNNLEATIAEAYKCKFMDLETVDITDVVDKLLQNIDMLKPRVGHFHKRFESAKFLSENEDILDKIFMLSESAPQNPSMEVHKTLQSLQNYDGFKQIAAKFAENKLEDNGVSTQSTTEDLIKSVTKGFDDVKPFLESVAPHVDAFVCLQNVQNFDQIPTAVKTIRDVRKINSVTIQKGVDAVEKVIEATEELIRLETSINNLKGANNPETNAMSVFPDKSKHSIVIGSSTRGILRLRRAVKGKSHFDDVIKHLELVKTEVSTVKTLAKENKENLLKLVNMEKDLHKMVSELSNWRSKAQVSNSKKLQDHVKIYFDAQQISGISEDFDKIIVSVGNLEASVSDQNKKLELKKLKSALSKLGSFRLDPSDYQTYLAQTKESLQALDLFFVDYEKKMLPLPTIVPRPTKKPGQSGKPVPSVQQPLKVTDTRKKDPEAENKQFDPVASGFIGAFCGGLVVFVGLAVWDRCFRNDKQPPPTPSEPEIKVVTPSVVPITTTPIQNPRVPKETLKPAKPDPPLTKEQLTQQFLAKKIEQQRNTTPMVMAKLKGGPKVKITQNAGQLYLKWLYNDILEFQKKSSKIKSNVLLPAMFIEYFKHSHTTALGYKRTNYTVDLKYINDSDEASKLDMHNMFIDEYLKTPQKYNNASTVRNPIPINSSTMVFVANAGKDYHFVFIHGNHVTMLDGKVLIVAQDPFVNPNDPISFEKMYEITKKYGTTSIVMLGNVQNNGQYFPNTSGAKLPPGGQRTTRKQFEHKSVRCTKILETDAEIRHLEVSDGCDKKDLTAADKIYKKEKSKYDSLYNCPRLKKENDPPAYGAGLIFSQSSIVHYQYLSSAVPRDLFSMAQILKAVYSQDYVIVHCSDGLGLSASFACCMYAFQSMCMNLQKSNNQRANVNFAHVMNRIRSHRTGAVKRPIYLAAAAMMLLDLVYAGEKMDAEHDKMYKELVVCYGEAVSIDERNTEEHSEVEDPKSPREQISEPKEKISEKGNSESKESRKTENTTKSHKSEKSKKDERVETKSKKGGRKEGDKIVAITMEAGKSKKSRKSVKKAQEG